jgi:hypothetical protein
LKEHLIEVTLQGNVTPLSQDSPQAKFIHDLKDDEMAGLSPSGALTEIMDLLAKAKSSSSVTTFATDNIIDSARNTIALIESPPDVACSMSVLSFNETSQAYRRLIANEYIAIQVVVRNLNANQPFVLHDAEFAVSTDARSLPNHFYAGRDKVVVRALSAAQASFDPRDIVVHSAEGVGAILSASVPIFNVPTLANATAVFNGAFVPGLDKYWKDMSTDQLNLLNDTGFSSQTGAQTSVPQLGTVTIVTFIPGRALEQSWWTQPCVNRVYLGTQDSRGRFVEGREVDEVRAKNEATVKDVPAKDVRAKTKLFKTSRAPITDPDIEHAIESCRLSYSPRESKKGKLDQHNSDMQFVPPKTKSGDTLSSDGPAHDVFRNAIAVPHRKWSGNTSALFDALSIIVISGDHITDDKQLQPLLTAINCAKDRQATSCIPRPTTDHCLAP